MLVYVLNRHGKPLMPCRPAKARILLKEKKAVVVKLEPFTIRLVFGSSGYRQKTFLGIDAGSKHIGVSVTTEQKEVFAAEVEVRNDIVKKLAGRREARRTRRNRLRYRKPRFNNRVHAKRKGWMAPSIQHKIETHLKLVEKICKILPVYRIVVEVASFDIQKIKNPAIQGAEYQQGEQLNFWNVREYVLFRDGYTCQCCKGKSKDKILNVHHIESRQTGGNAPNNLITLCETCHKKYHRGELELPKTIRRGMKFKDPAFMGIMRWAFYNRLKSYCEERQIACSLTYGYRTKHMRIVAGLPKTHCVDARCISGNPLAIPSDTYFYCKKVRRNNRQMYKANLLKGGIVKPNQAPFIVHGYRLFDKVRFKNKLYYIFSRRQRGDFDIRTLDGTKVNKGSVSWKKMMLVQKRTTWLIERRPA